MSRFTRVFERQICYRSPTILARSRTCHCLRQTQNADIQGIISPFIKKIVHCSFPGVIPPTMQAHPGRFVFCSLPGLCDAWPGYKTCAQSELFSARAAGATVGFWIRASARRLADAGLVCSGACPRGPLVPAGVRVSGVKLEIQVGSVPRFAESLVA